MAILSIQQYHHYKYKMKVKVKWTFYTQYIVWPLYIYHLSTRVLCVIVLVNGVFLYPWCKSTNSQKWFGYLSIDSSVFCGLLPFWEYLQCWAVNLGLQIVVNCLSGKINFTSLHGRCVCYVFAHINMCTIFLTISQILEH